MINGNVQQVREHVAYITASIYMYAFVRLVSFTLTDRRLYYELGHLAC